MNGRPGAYNCIGDLKEWFFRQNKPYWILWNSIAPISSLKINFRKDSNMDIESVEESWNILEQSISNTGRYGGDFTIKIDTNKRMNNSMFATLSLSINGVSGINGFPSAQGAQVAGYVTKEQFDTWKSEYENKRRIEDLESELEEVKHGSDMTGRFMRFAENNPDLVTKLAPGAINFINGLFKGNQVPISVQGFGDNEQKEMDKINHDAIEESLNRIAKHFDDIPSFLITLADYIDSHPEMAKQLFNTHGK
ncbi:MAG: hypothetical protein GXO85_02245 [Chlorobi bacterium]|nr:hypothetical protein [Chlorobiota bacterium]